MNKLKTETQLTQTIVRGSLFSEMNTEMLLISTGIQLAKESEFEEDWNFCKTTPQKDIRLFLDTIAEQNKRLVVLNQSMIRLRERFGKNYR
jgi:hypothetical protein